MRKCGDDDSRPDVPLVDPEVCETNMSSLKFVFCALSLIAGAFGTTSHAYASPTVRIVPSSYSPVVGSDVTMTLFGTLTNAVLLDVQVAFPTLQLAPEFKVDCSVDASGLYGGQVSGTANSLTSVCATSSGFDFSAIAFDALSTNGDVAIVRLPFLALNAGRAVLTFTTCVADPTQVCDSSDTAVNAVTLNIQPRGNVPEPTSLGLLVAALLIQAGMGRYTLLRGQL
jgi:hypothetical protein